MRVSETLSRAFETEFQLSLARFLTQASLLEFPEQIENERFLARSILPHVQKLSDRFNRIDTDRAPDALYWKDTSNRDNLKLAYFLGFAPCNQMRVASIWQELARLGWRWGGQDRFRAIEWGAGPAAATTGIALAESLSSTGLPAQGTWALLERDRGVLELGRLWAEARFEQLGRTWEVQTFARELGLEQPWLPRNAPRFDLWVESFFMNELWGAEGSSSEIPLLAQRLLENWATHLNPGGLVILVEPALRAQSRKLLELRKELVPHLAKAGIKILLPCLGEQACGALARKDDWCHEEVDWWRAPYFKKLDRLSGMDHKSLGFSYLVLCKSDRSIEEILPALGSSAPRQRLVSPAQKQGSDREFFICGQDGKRRARWKTQESLERGDILGESQVRGSPEASRVESARLIEQAPSR